MAAHRLDETNNHVYRPKYPEHEFKQPSKYRLCCRRDELLGKVANCNDDVQLADSVSRKDHRQQRENETDRECNQYRVNCDGEVNRERFVVGRTKSIGHDHNEGTTDQNANRGSNRCGPDRISEALKSKHLNKVPTLSSDRTCDPHLLLPLRRQQDEYQEYEEQTNDHREGTEEREKGEEKVADLLRDVG